MTFERAVERLAGRLKNRQSGVPKKSQFLIDANSLLVAKSPEVWFWEVIRSTDGCDQTLDEWRAIRKYSNYFLFVDNSSRTPSFVSATQVLGFPKMRNRRRKQARALANPHSGRMTGNSYLIR
jgi:hypothetical protein